MAVSNTARLFIKDIGRVPRGTNKGEYGQMNWGLITYYHKPDAQEMRLLGELFGVTAREPRRWFGKPDQFGRVEYRNCVSPRLRGQRVVSMKPADRRRVFLGACLGAKGGLTRAPPFTRGQRDGTPFVEVTAFPTLAECVTYIEAVYDGTVDTALQQGWARITIERATDEWEVVIERYYPRPDETSDFDEAADAEMGDSTE